MIQPRHTCTPASLIGHVLRAEDIQSLLEGAVILPNGHANQAMVTFLSRRHSHTIGVGQLPRSTFGAYCP